MNALLVQAGLTHCFSNVNIGKVFEQIHVVNYAWI